jgi:Rieske Fe-S protein
MDRREFIKNSCNTCLSATVISGMLSSCRATRYISGTLGKDGLFIDATEFITKQNGQKAYRSYIIVRNDALQYPVCVYRFNDNEYSALWMRCTHQGTEMQVSGDRLQCTAHGSEFDNKGSVKTGPADKSLRSFPVTVSDNQLFIDMRAI